MSTIEDYKGLRKHTGDRSTGGGGGLNNLKHLKSLELEA